MKIRRVTATSWSVQWKSGYCTDIDFFVRIRGGFSFEIACWQWGAHGVINLGLVSLISWDTYNPADCAALGEMHEEA